MKEKTGHFPDSNDSLQNSLTFPIRTCQKQRHWTFFEARLSLEAFEIISSPSSRNRLKICKTSNMLKHIDIERFRRSFLLKILVD